MATASVVAAESPEVTALSPAGIQVGQSRTVRVLGKPGSAPVSVWCSSPTLKVEPGDKPDSFILTAQSDAIPGKVWLRWHNAEGASAPRPFWIGAEKEIDEVEPNNTISQATPVESVPVVLNGVLHSAGEVDIVRVSLEQGQTLVANLEANRSLPSPMDAVLQILGPSGFIVAQNDDDHGNDPLMTWTAVEAGPHYVRLFSFPSNPDSSIRFAGGENFVYRLALTTGPFVTHLEPRIEPPGAVALRGWNIDDSKSTLTLSHPIVMPKGTLTSLQLDALPRLNGTLQISSEAAVTPSQPQVSLPAVVSGRLDNATTIDRFRFDGRAKQSIHIEGYTTSIGSLADLVIQLQGPDGKTIKEVDDSDKSGTAPRFDHVLPVDGIYTVVIQERYGHFGPRHFYLLNVTETKPDVNVTVAANRFTLEVGKSLEVPISLARQPGFNERLSFQAKSLPAGVTSTPVESPGDGDASKSVSLKITAAADAPPSSSLLQIEGHLVGGMEQVIQVQAPVDNLDATTGDLWITVIPAKN